MNEFLAGVTLCLLELLRVCAVCVCVCRLMNPIEPKRAAPTTLLQDPFTATVNLQESHQCVSECV